MEPVLLFLFKNKNEVKWQCIVPLFWLWSPEYLLWLQLILFLSWELIERFFCWYQDIIHCHDWSSAPVAWLFKEQYMHYGLSKARLVFTIHNLEFGAQLIGKAMAFSDKATTVSSCRSFDEEAISHELWLFWFSDTLASTGILFIIGLD